MLFAVDAADEARVRSLVEGALAGGEWTYPDGVVSHWTVVSSGADAVRLDEREHADRLVAVLTHALGSRHERPGTAGGLRRRLVGGDRQLHRAARGAAAEAWPMPTDLPGWDVHACAAHTAHLEAVLSGAPEETLEIEAGPHISEPGPGLHRAGRDVAGATRRPTS